MNRRDFLFTLGAGTAFAVSGYFLWDSEKENKTVTQPVSSDKPKLNSNVHTEQHENGMLKLSHESNSCFVNITGQQVISFMDGRNTIINIAQKIAGFYSLEYSDELITSIATFVSQLANAGFLKSPFYATLYENYS
jgi:hypothetical protein